MGKYIVKETICKTYKSTGGLDVIVPAQSKYSVMWSDKGSETTVFICPDYFKDPKGICEGACKLLNQQDIILPLDI